MKKATSKYKCRYCGAAVYKENDMCGNCKSKKKIMNGWHWLFNGKEIIKKED